MPSFALTDDRMVIFVIQRTQMRGIDLYKNCLYEIDRNIGKVLINNKMAVAAEVDFQTKWTLKQTPLEYLSANPTGKKGMMVRQYMAIQRGVGQVPRNYKEKPAEPVILDETPHEEREKTNEPVAANDSVSE